MPERAACLDPATVAAYREVAGRLAGLASGPAPIVGICGAQGSGKSTLAAFIRQELADTRGLRAVIVSIDDLYLTQAERRALAADVHPLLATRGAPGTHDIALARGLFARLRALRAGERLSMPVFDKSIDDRLPPSEWATVDGPVDMVLFEGWCVGVPPEPEARLAEPINALERREDADGRWRHAVNGYLAGEYARLFAELDVLLFLQIPGWDMALRWRREQEDGNRARGRGEGMSDVELARFMEHYERLTSWSFESMPMRADILLKLNHDHGIETMDDTLGQDGQ